MPAEVALRVDPVEEPRVELEQRAVELPAQPALEVHLRRDEDEYPADERAGRSAAAAPARMRGSSASRARTRRPRPASIMKSGMIQGARKSTTSPSHLRPVRADDVPGVPGVERLRGVDDEDEQHACDLQPVDIRAPERRDRHRLGKHAGVRRCVRHHLTVRPDASGLNARRGHAPPRPGRGQASRRESSPPASRAREQRVRAGGCRVAPAARGTDQRGAAAARRTEAVTRAVRPAAWAALAASALVACVHDVYRAEPIGSPGPDRPEALRVLVFGDFGFQSIPQRLAADAMRRATRGRPFDLALEVGDNIYHCGPEPTRPGADTCRFEDDGVTVAPGARPPDDPLFRVNEAPLAGLRGRDGAPLPIFLALGNHDVGLGGGRCARASLGEVEAMRRRACLSVARRTPAWSMPARHYVLDRGPVRFVVLDTNVAVRDYGGFTLADEIAFVREATATCGAERLCFLVGHHPPAAAHGYGRRRPLPYAARDRATRRGGRRPRAGLPRRPRTHARARLDRRPRGVHLGQHCHGRLRKLQDAHARAHAGPVRHDRVGLRRARDGRAPLPGRVLRHERRGPALLRGRRDGAVPAGLLRLRRAASVRRDRHAPAALARREPRVLHGAGPGSRSNACASVSTLSR